MHRCLTAIAIAAAATTAAMAQEPMDASAFADAVTGFTVTYNNASGNYAGVEAYHPGNRVTWIGEGGTCQKGTWYQNGSEICFAYQGQFQHPCWTFFQSGGTLMAAPSPTAEPWTATSITTDPIGCTSPFLGS